MPFVAVEKILADIFAADTAGSSVVRTGMNSVPQKIKQALPQRPIRRLTSMETKFTTVRERLGKPRPYVKRQGEHGPQLVTNP